MMLKPFLLIVLLVLAGRDASAQQPVPEPSSLELQSCLMGTPISTWQRLQLTTDQMERMRRVQEACKEECDLPDVKKVDNPISNADGTMVMSEVKYILSKEQYQAWVAYCTASPAGASPAK